MKRLLLTFSTLIATGAEPLLAATCPKVSTPLSAEQAYELPLGKSQAECRPQQVVSCPANSSWFTSSDTISADGSRVVRGFCVPRRPNTTTEPSLVKETLEKGDTELSKQIRSDNPIRIEVADASSNPTALTMPADLLKKARALGMPEVVLRRGFDNYVRQISAGKTKRPCFMAGDLTTSERATMYMVCTYPKTSITKTKSFFGSGEGSGCFSTPYKNNNGCAKYFGNRPNYCLPAGGNYLTGITTQRSGSQRDFLELNGLDKDENSNARQRRTGFHYAVHADGRPYDKKNFPEASQGCFTLPSDLKEFAIGDMSSSHAGGGLPVYIYPSKSDIQQAVAGKDVYWDASCKEKIKKPGWVGTKDLVIDYATTVDDDFKAAGDILADNDEDSTDPTKDSSPKGAEDFPVPGDFRMEKPEVLATQ